MTTKTRKATWRAKRERARERARKRVRRERRALSDQADTGSPASRIFADCLAGLIQKLPNGTDLTMLQGVASAQASFFFKSPTTDDINASFYNSLLSPRVQGLGKDYGVQQAKLLSSAFTNSYLDVYNQLRFQLSQADKATMQQVLAEVAGAVKAIRPIWNEWVDVFGKNMEPPVPPLSEDNTDSALIVLTAVVQSMWINPDFKQKLKDDSTYPYTHMNEFDQIFSEIPPSVPAIMRDGIKEIYAKQGAAGGITARQATATQVQTGIRKAIEKPSAANGGMPLTGTNKRAPGLTFAPADPITLVDELKTEPPNKVLNYSSSIQKDDSSTLTFEASTGGGISIPILDFLSVSVGGHAEGSIFTHDYAGSRFDIEIVVNNPTINPSLVVEPLLYNISTNQGWLFRDPVVQAVNNADNTDVTGWVFDGGMPNYDFSEGGDFGYINSFVFSQFLELKLKFVECESHAVKEYFEQHVDAKVSFLGIPLGGASESSSYSYSYSEETETSITVTLKPKPPGCIPGGTDITESLCNLLAVGVIYPFAQD